MTFGILINLQNEDVTKSILPSLHHLEKVEDPSTDVERHSAIDRSAAKFEDAIAHTKAERKCRSQRKFQVRRSAEANSSNWDCNGATQRGVAEFGLGEAGPGKRGAVPRA